MKKPTHGGKRRGAGRPKEDRAPVLVTPLRATAARMRARARREKTTMGKLLDEVF